MSATRIASLIEARIRDGSLPPGARLPTHRDLAYEHQVALATATRAMRLLINKGIVSGEVGRGSYVRAPGHADGAVFRNEAALPDRINLGGSNMLLPDLGERFELAARMVLRRSRDALLDYQPHAGRDEDRAAGALWLSRAGHLPNDPARVVICAGAQHALLVALMATTRPGDTVAVEALAWPGIKAAAAALQLELVPVALDGDGMRPRDLLRIAARRRIAAVYLTPTIQNPTSAILPLRRREAIAALARRLDFQIIEDDAYGFLAEDAPPPLAALEPERTWHARTVSKSLAQGLRTAWLLVPPRQTDRAADLVRATVWTAPALGAAITSMWIADGSAVQIEAEKRREAASRQELAASMLPAAWRRRTHPKSMHMWVELPGGLRAAEAVRRASDAGVRVTSGEAFAMSGVPNAVRLALGRPPRREDLAKALGQLVGVWT